MWVETFLSLFLLQFTLIGQLKFFHDCQFYYDLWVFYNVYLHIGTLLLFFNFYLLTISFLIFNMDLPLVQKLILEFWIAEANFRLRHFMENLFGVYWNVFNDILIWMCEMCESDNNCKITYLRNYYCVYLLELPAWKW